MPYWFNGQPHQGNHLEIAVDDPAFIYGATTFTTLRVYHHDLDHPLTHWSDHCQRLGQALAACQWSDPDWPVVRQGAEWLKAEFPILRITCFPDGQELITGRPLPADLDRLQREGIMAWVAQGEVYRRSLPSYKTGNYLGSWLALRAAQRQGAREAILTNGAGDWLETSTGNLWGWAQGQWWTPPGQAGLLPGVTRQYLLDYLQRQGLAVCQAPWTKAVVAGFEALAYANSGLQVVPIHTVLGDRSRLEFNPYHRELQALCWAFQGG
ncbi:MAG TPA: aminotransferase class IV [Leptolyngbyaceae cyanobacterium M65_K2018_010]|nr:aminotransferase class IV [Leptolyngbyaceae cyanobacterium M65_K2018_010]